MLIRQHISLNKTVPLSIGNHYVEFTPEPSNQGNTYFTS